MNAARLLGVVWADPYLCGAITRDKEGVSVMAEKSDFEEVVADVFRVYKKDFEGRPIIGDTGTYDNSGKPPVDRSVREQVVSDFDRMIDKHTGKH
jgi:hypothetical protein